MPKLKSLAYLLRNHLNDFNNDNLHRVAISNLDDGRREVERWWCKKYGRPLKEFEDHTMEELMVEMFEDFYAKNPQEVQKFEHQVAVSEEWDGSMPIEHERKMQERAKKRPQQDLSKWQSDAVLTEEEEKNILDSLGRNLPNSKRIVNMGGEGEFDEQFLGEE